ncbi:MAG: uncharacterized protein QOH03_287, partial [Kribbellaceae bacterium]|nr:uncharacterized protein [Kribbellaceae bacterium]
LAEAQIAWNAAQTALKAGNLGEYQKQLDLVKVALDRAVAAGNATPTTTPTAKPSGTPSSPTSPTSPPSSPTG